MNFQLKNKTLDYWPEIDGIRAIAVISVILFHFNIPYFKGGFIGVDVFFCISGFLISRIIISKVETNNFSFLDFYLNRTKRLLPALYFLLLVCLVVGFFIFDYLSLRDLGKQIVSTNLYFSNFLFWRDAGYFDLPPILKPLLHTWSLSIEEQFYLVFPLFIFLTYRLGKKYFLIVGIVLFISSFALNIYGVSHFKSATFYLLPTRVWEFQIGTFVFLIQKNKIYKYNIFIALTFLLGLVLLFISIFLFSSETEYPGWPSVLPVLGTALIIITVRSIPIRFLNNKILIFFGKISYSLYLWHWPIYAFGKYMLMRDPELWESWILIFISILISWVSWKYIENPFRFKVYTPLKKKHFYFGILFVTLFITILGFTCYKSDGFPQRSSLNNLLIDVNSDSLWNEYLQSGISFSKGNIKQPLIIGSKVDTTKILLWGDSHARAIALGMNEYFIKNRVGCYLASLSSTPPLMGIRNSKSVDLEFEEFNSKVFNFIKKHPEIQKVILCSRWSYYINDNYPELELRSQPIFRKIVSKDNSVTNSKSAVFNYGLNCTIDSLTKLGKSIYLVDPVPELKQDVRILLGNHFIMRIQDKSINDYGEEQEQYVVKNNYILKLFKSHTINPNVKILKIEKSLFRNNLSIIIDKGKLLYKDDNHLSKFGSNYVINNYKDLFYDLQ